MYEEQIHKAEEDYNIIHQSDATRRALHEINDKYIKFLKFKDTILKKKTELQWFKDGHTNSKFFHSIIRERRRKLFMHKIISEEREWIQDDEDIAQTARPYFEKIFTGEEKFINEDTLECIPKDSQLVLMV